MIEYLFFRLIIEVFRFVPFFLLYLMADITALLMKILGYRRKVIEQNLKNSFPEKSEKELTKIKNKFYLNLADILLESIKGYTLSKKQFEKRYTVENPEVDIKYYNEGKNVIYAGGHFGNWEWGTQASPFVLKHKVVILYKPLKNKYIDRFIKKKRERFGVKMVSINITARSFVNQLEPFCVIMLADQNPSNRKKAIWVNFLNRPTPVLQGVEVYAKLKNTPVLFFNTYRVKRGYYKIKLFPLTDRPRELPKGQITKLFMQRLEAEIKKYPYMWLWSHKRWKYPPDKDTIIY